MTHAHVKNGVIIPDPAHVYIAADVPAGAIAAGVTLHPGARIEGARTSIGPGSVIGREGPAVVIDCQLGREVALGSGYFESSVFLDGASMGGGAHVRPGCLIEEQAGGAHTVGLKQTVLMSYVTLGSLINFCDCLMAGGTSRKNHSEVGSSFIHFNFTPRQDKATASLIGDVVRGVLLDQPPVFLGGQGGLVGPVRIAFGAVIPAGHIVRRDVEQAGQLVMPPPSKIHQAAFDPKVYGRIDRVVRNNLTYIGNLKALRAWYREVRRPFMVADPFQRACHEGALRVLGSVIDERIKRLGEVAAKMPESMSRLEAADGKVDAEIWRQQKKLSDTWGRMREALATDDEAATSGGTAHRALAEVAAPHGVTVAFTDWVARLDASNRASVKAWLGAIVEKAQRVWSI